MKHFTTAELKGRIDFAIICIREDEYSAVLDRFKPDALCDGSRRYRVGAVPVESGGQYQFVAVKCPEQGEGVAHDVARDIIEDVAPNWILLVGICGAVPSRDFTLGDVVCATRLTDFTVRAALEGKPDEYNVTGGPMHRNVENLLADLPALLREMKGWNNNKAVRRSRPEVKIPDVGSDKLYGDVEFKRSVRECLEYHFTGANRPHRPLATAQQVASSDALIKSPSLIKQWQQIARSVSTVEMELGGVYRAARRRQGETPILGIRGISDVVGFKRHEAWTKYACHTAAAFAIAVAKGGHLGLPAQQQLTRSPLIPDSAGPPSPVRVTQTIHNSGHIGHQTVIGNLNK